MDLERGSKRRQMFILEISWRPACGWPCGARPHMKGNAGFECRRTDRPAGLWLRLKKGLCKTEMCMEWI